MFADGLRLIDAPEHVLQDPEVSALRMLILQNAGSRHER
jgi:hypothetical protein